MFNFSLKKQVRKTHQLKRDAVIRTIKGSLITKYKQVSLSCTIVSETVSQEYNLQYRDRNYPTNVISLEYGTTRDEYAMLCGELILCDAVIAREALELNKSIAEHYTHMLVHGMLHLQGLTHEDDVSAAKMEQLEATIMQKLGFGIISAKA